MAENKTFPAWPKLEVTENTSALQLGTQWNIKIGFVLMRSVRTIIYSFRLSSMLSTSLYTHANIVSNVGAVYWFPFRNTPHESCFLYRTLSRISPSSLIYKSRNLSCAQKCNKNAKEACVLHISNAARWYLFYLHVCWFKRGTTKLEWCVKCCPPMHPHTSTPCCFHMNSHTIVRKLFVHWKRSCNIVGRRIILETVSFVEPSRLFH